MKTIKVGDTTLTPEIVELVGTLIDNNSPSEINELKTAVVLGMSAILETPAEYHRDENRARYGSKLAELYTFLDEFQRIIQK